MLKQGTVVRVDFKSNTGIIKDKKGKEFFFSVEDCKNLTLPKLYTSVSFYRDQDYKNTDVAIYIASEDTRHAS